MGKSILKAYLVSLIHRSPPKVPYKITYLASKSRNNQRSSDAPSTEVIEDLSKWPAQGMRFKVEEPVVDVSFKYTVHMPCVE